MEQQRSTHVIRSAALVGIDAVMIGVELEMASGASSFTIVGLADGAARESTVRITSALMSTGLAPTKMPIAVRLSPINLRKEGPAFELPIALGTVAAMGLLEQKALQRYVIAGELALDGAVKSIRGVLPLALTARAAGFKGVMVPAANAAEAALVDGLDVIAVEHLLQAVRHLTGEATLAPYARSGTLSPEPGHASHRLDMADIHGHAEAKDALELAAAGGHHVVMRGPPGSGKTMLARRLPGILPRMGFYESLDVTRVYSALGLLPVGQPQVLERPFRAPHHTISGAGLLGGGPLPRPGELSLAHHGVLFLDELPEFRQTVLESLQQPLDMGVVHLARANQHVTYPCQVMLVAAMNPCPCGYFNFPGRSCTCSERRIHDYQARVSGPLLDRIDVFTQTRPIKLPLSTAPSADARPSAYFRARVEGARDRQRHRFADEPGVHLNAQMPSALLREHCPLTARAQQLLELTVRQQRLSPLEHARLLKLARTHADLDGRDLLDDADIQVALTCRSISPSR